MTGAGRRAKGQRGERELAKLLSEHLGAGVLRNLSQTRDGGHDLLGIAGWSIECKRQESLSLAAWWQQAVEQAEKVGLRPCLAYRQSRRPWRFIVRLADLGAGIDQEHVAEVNSAAFAAILRGGFA